MTIDRFERFVKLFDKVFNLTRGDYGYVEGGGDNPFTVYLTHDDDKLWIAGEGRHFSTAEIGIDELYFECNEETLKAPYMSFSANGKVVWYISCDGSVERRDYERLLFLCEEYNDERGGAR